MNSAELVLQFVGGNYVSFETVRYARSLYKALEGRKIAAIKLLRELPSTGLTLKEAKDLYEYVEVREWIDNLPYATN